MIYIYIYNVFYVFLNKTLFKPYMIYIYATNSKGSIVHQLQACWASHLFLYCTSLILKWANVCFNQQQRRPQEVLLCTILNNDDDDDDKFVPYWTTTTMVTTLYNTERQQRRQQRCTILNNTTDCWQYCTSTTFQFERVCRWQVWHGTLTDGRDWD